MPADSTCPMEQVSSRVQLDRGRQELWLAAHLLDCFLSRVRLPVGPLPRVRLGEFYHGDLARTFERTSVGLGHP